ncbi:MAG: cache domain-containing protein, partial [Christensenellales bacterium]
KIQSIMKTADEGGGFNEFYFTKSDGKTVAPKVAYSQKFDKWNWVITTGIYSDDIQGIVQKSTGLNKIIKIFSCSTSFLIIVTVVLVVLMLVVSYIIVRQLVGVIERVRGKLESVASGDLSSTLDGKVVSRSDELGQMVAHTNLAIKSFRDSISKAKETAGTVQNNSTDIKGKTETALTATSQVAKAIEHVATDVTTQVDLLS